MNSTTQTLPPTPTSRWAPPAPRIGVLLLHGITGTSTEMRPLARHLQQMGYCVEAPMLPGHGAGYHEMLATTWEDWLSGVRQAKDALAAACDRVVVVGLSAAGLLTALLAAEDPRINAVVFLAMHLGIPGSGIARRRSDYVLAQLLLKLPAPIRRHWYFIEHPPYGLKDERLQQRITQAIAASQRGATASYGLFRTYVETIYQIRLLERAVEQRASAVRAPALLMHSVEDTMLSIENATTMYRLLGSTEKSIEFISGCDHVITVDLRKDEVARRVSAFISRTVSQPSMAHEAIV